MKEPDGSPRPDLFESGRPPLPAMAHTGSPSGPEEAPPLPPLLRRVVMVVVSPVELFRALRENPAVIGPLLLGAVLMGVAAALIPIELTQEVIRERLIEAGQDPGNAVGTIARVTWIFSIFGPLLFWPVMAIITAGLYALVFLFAFGYEGRFRQLLSVTAHALLVAALGALLVAPLRIMAGDPQLTLSIGSMLLFLEDGFLATFLGLMDLFNLWTYVLIGIGAAVVDGGRTHLHGVMVAVGTAILITLVIASFVA